MRFALAHPAPVWGMRAQRTPVAYAMARAEVLEALYHAVTARHGRKGNGILDLHIPAVFKSLAFKFWRSSGIGLTDKLGAQGLFDFNQVIAMDVSSRSLHTPAC